MLFGTEYLLSRHAKLLQEAKGCTVSQSVYFVLSMVPWLNTQMGEHFSEWLPPLAMDLQKPYFSFKNSLLEVSDTFGNKDV